VTGRPAIRPAAAGELEWAAAFVAAAGLPADGLGDQFPGAYRILEADGQRVGLAGLERYGGSGLLRSVAVAEGWRGTGAGALLVADSLARAREAGLAAVYLLTTTADRWFPRFGFRAVARAALPGELAAAPEVAGGCPASATAMRLLL
jgi:amino-acid N-acetyltransferase